jgi:septum formation protein
LEQLGLACEITPADVDERPYDGEDPVAYVQRVANAKAEFVAQQVPEAVVLAADTTVDLDGRIVAKPVDRDDARAMLASLSARTHRVHTGVAVHRSGKRHHSVVTTLVTFVPLDEHTIEWYLNTGEPFDKAGAYGLQGAGGVLVERVQGSVSNVIGLPLAPTVALLEAAGLVWTQLR